MTSAPLDANSTFKRPTPETPYFEYRPVSRLTRVVLITIGTISVILGIIATILPVIPTTPFVFITAICYGRSSETLYNRLINSRLVGENYHNLREGRGLPLRVKLGSLAMAWTMLSISAFLLVESLPIKILLISIAVIKTIVMIKIKTLKPEEA